MRLRPIIIACSILVTLLQGYPTSAQEIPARSLIAMGSNYSENLRDFWEVIAAQDGIEEIRILALPLGYSKNPRKITRFERNEYLKYADKQRARLESDCQLAISPGFRCTVTLVPILVRPDANNQEFLQSLESRPTAILILGDNQDAAMQVIASTPVEIALSEAYQKGVIIAGASAGAGIQSTSMVAGYNPGYEASNSLSFGASMVLNNPREHGLLFGLQNAIVEPHFYEQNRFGRLLNAIALPDTAHLGIGIDAETGFQIVEEDILKNIFGQSTITILDADTYHSAEAVQYQGPEHLLSIRNVLFHMFSPGAFIYSLDERSHSLAPFPERLERRFESITLPSGAGTIIIDSGSYKDAYQDPNLLHFINLSGGKKANLAIFAMGYPNEKVAQEAVDALIEGLNVTRQIFLVNPQSPETLKIDKETSGILLMGETLGDIKLETIGAIYDAWISGIPLLSKGQVSAILGKYYTTQIDIQSDKEMRIGFHQGDVEISPGLNLLNLNIEPQVMKKNRWAQFISLAYHHPDILTLGPAEGAALVFSSHGAMAQGKNVTLALDFNQATLDIGSNQGLVVANGLLDVFAPGDWIQPENADIDSAPIQLSTPVLYKVSHTPPPSTKPPTPQLTPSPTPTGKPDQQPGSLMTMPSGTPIPELASTKIPPADPNLSRLIIGAGIIIVLVVIFGVWINRQRLQ